ncbi:MAG: hypothetical protein WC965_00995 [Thiohalomonadaceae bacterium]
MTYKIVTTSRKDKTLTFPYMKGLRREEAEERAKRLCKTLGQVAGQRFWVEPETAR